MTVKNIKLHTEYRLGSDIVKVVKRVKNSRFHKWHDHRIRRPQKIHLRRETTFILDNGKEVFAKQLSALFN